MMKELEKEYLESRRVFYTKQLDNLKEEKKEICAKIDEISKMLVAAVNEKRRAWYKMRLGMLTNTLNNINREISEIEEYFKTIIKED